MDEKVNTKSEFRCIICNKTYSSGSSLCNHNKKYHTNTINKCQVLSDNVKLKCQVVSRKIICDVCNKEFNTRQAKSLHKKKCYIIQQNNNTDNELKIKEMELQLKLQEKEILKLKLKLQNPKMQM